MAIEGADHIREQHRIPDSPQRLHTSRHIFVSLYDGGIGEAFRGESDVRLPAGVDLLRIGLATGSLSFTGIFI